MGDQAATAVPAASGSATATLPAINPSPGSAQSIPDASNLSPRQSASNTTTIAQNSVSSEQSFPVSADQSFQKSFAIPILSDVAKCVSSTSAAVHKIEDLIIHIDDVRRQKIRKDLVAHTTAPLPSAGDSFEQVISRLEDLIVYDEIETEHGIQRRPVLLNSLESDGKVATLAHSLSAYISVLDPIHLRRLTATTLHETTMWVTKLFRFFGASAYFHEDAREGLVRVIRFALLKRVPRYMQDGFETIYSHPPVIYMTSASRAGLGQHICLQLGLPMSCICMVPCLQKPGSQFKMDISVLQKLMQEDAETGKLPLAVVANAGAPVSGQMDDVAAMKEVCKKYNVWLHLEGNNLATMALLPVPNAMELTAIGDSIVVSLGAWLGLPNLPYITLYNAGEVPPLASTAGLAPHTAQLRLNCLPVWLVLQTLGTKTITARIRHACLLTATLLEEVCKIAGINVISHGKEDQAGRAASPFKDLLVRAITSTAMFELVSSTVVFKFEVASKQKVPSVDGTSDEAEKSATYCAALNSWLGQMLQRECPQVKIEMIELENYGIAIRYCALENSHANGTSVEQMQEFIESLKVKLGILSATVKQREAFGRLVHEQPNLEEVYVSNWAGLGAVVYVPDDFVERYAQLSDHDKNELNKVNIEIVHRLKANDAAFTSGESPDGLICVRFGMVTEETDTSDLIGMVYQIGREVEEASRYVETMAEAVKQGIQAAASELTKENDNKLMQEGVLRQVPLVGSFINWWSPPPKQHGVKGRSFYLPTGAIESTEQVYEKRMQLKVARGSSSSSTGRIPSSKSEQQQQRKPENGGPAGDSAAAKAPSTNSDKQPPDEAAASQDDVFLPEQRPSLTAS